MWVKFEDRGQSPRPSGEIVPFSAMGARYDYEAKGAVAKSRPKYETIN